MKKRILAILLVICMAATCIAPALAEEEEPAPPAEEKRQAPRSYDPNLLLAGDANVDGKVSVTDVTMILRFCVGLNSFTSFTGLINADIDGNGATDTNDAANILRHVAGLTVLSAMTPIDQTLFDELMVLSYFNEEYTAYVARYIQTLPKGNRRNVLYAAAKYIGTPYGTGNGQLDCSKFVATAYADAGIAKDVYPGKNSDGTLNWYRTNCPEKLHEVEVDGWYFDSSKWTPGTVLIYINPETGKGDHLALYVGNIYGYDIIMDSGSDGTRLNEVWSGGKWELTYYVDPLS